MEKKVSVIIPVFNTEALLGRCLESVISQNYGNFEVICIDDCSSDGSRAILDRYANLYKNKIKVIYNSENIGQGRSRMKGIAAAEGEYLFFVDSDDYIDKNYIKTYISQVKNVAYDVVVGGFTRDENGKLDIHRNAPSIWSIISYSHACCKMYRRAFLLDNNIDFGDFRKGEDIYFSLMLVLHKGRHKFIDYSGYYYYANNNSTTKSMDYNSNFELVVSDIFTEILKKRKCYKPNSKLENYLEYAYVASMVNALIVYSHGCKADIMMRKYAFFKHDFKKKFEGFESNRALYKWHFSGPSLKCRLGVWVTMNAMRFHVDKLLFTVISFI